MKRIFKYLCLMSFIILLNGCVHYQMNMKNFPLIKKAQGFHEQRDEVLLSAQALDKEKTIEQFGVDLTAKDYIVIQLHFENRTNDTLIIRPSYIGLTIADPAKVAKLLHYDTSFFVTTAGALALLFWWPGTYWVGRTGYDMYQNNRRINEILEYTSLDEDQELKIMPHEVINKYIFVSRFDFVNAFTLKIFNKTQRKIITYFVTL